MEMKSDGENYVYFMLLAHKEDEEAFKKGEDPVGAVLVKEGAVLTSAHNLRESLKDPSARAEIIALLIFMLGRIGAKGDINTLRYILVLPAGSSLYSIETWHDIFLC